MNKTPIQSNDKDKLIIRLDCMIENMDKNFESLKRDFRFFIKLWILIACIAIPATAKYLFMS